MLVILMRERRRHCRTSHRGSGAAVAPEGCNFPKAFALIIVPGPRFTRPLSRRTLDISAPTDRCRIQNRQNHYPFERLAHQRWPRCPSFQP